MAAFREWVRKDLTAANIVIFIWIALQGLQYATKWVWAQDNDAKTQAQRIDDIQQTVKAQHEAIETQHTFSEVVNVRLANIESQLKELKELVLQGAHR